LVLQKIQKIKMTRILAAGTRVLQQEWKTISFDITGIHWQNFLTCRSMTYSVAERGHGLLERNALFCSQRRFPAPQASSSPVGIARWLLNRGFRLHEVADCRIWNQFLRRRSLSARERRIAHLSHHRVDARFPRSRIRLTCFYA
jgi:hypothetical protein